MTVKPNENIFREVAEGRVSTEEALRLLRAAPTSVPPVSITTSEPAPDLVPFVLSYFTGKIAAALSVAPGDVDADAQLMDLGLDSAALLQMADELETELGITLYPTVFFEHTTLTAVAGHFAAEHDQAFSSLRGTSAPPAAPVSPAPEPSEPPASTAPMASDTTTIGLEPKVLGYFTGKIAAALSVTPSDVDADAQLMDLGLDSAALLRMADELENELGITLYPTVFFEHTTLTAVAGHFAAEHGQAFAKLFGGVFTDSPEAPTEVSPPVPGVQVVLSPQEDAALTQMVGAVAEVLSVPPNNIDVDADLMDLGLDSAALMTLAERIESGSAAAFNPALFFEHRTLRSLCVALASIGIGGSDTPAQRQPAKAMASQDGTCFFGFRDVPVTSAKTGRPSAIFWMRRGGSWSSRYGDQTETEPADALAAKQPDAVCYVIDPDLPGADTLNDVLKAAISDVSALVTALGLKAQTRIVIATPAAPGHAAAIAMGLSAFLKSVCLEYGNLKCVLLETDHFSEQGLQAVVHRALGATATQFAHLKATEAGLAIRHTVPVELPPEGVRLRRSSVVLVSGGAGALGLMFARHLLTTSAARVILIGRRRNVALPPDLVALARETGGDLHYESCDIAAFGAVQRLVDRVLSRFGTVDGVIHAAGVIDDQPLARKTEAARAAVIDPKVAGVLNLDAATRHLPLDLFACFSSIAGFTGNKGQSDYAPANGFLDGYMANRAELVRHGLRSGRSLSINWPLWSEGGMQPNPKVRDLMRQHLGLDSLSTDAGLACFDRALAGTATQVAVFAGDVERIRAWIAETNQDLPIPKTDTPALKVAPVDETPVARQVTDQPSAMQQLGRQPAAVPDTAPVTTGGQKRTPAKSDRDDLAIVGMACRLPGSPNADQLWQNLLAERDLISTCPERWTFDRFDETVPNSARDKILALECGFIDDVIGFDPDALNISWSEAERMDPQQRLALVCAWHALENAGYDPKRLRGQKIGVFVASSTRDFQSRYRSVIGFRPDGNTITAHSATGIAPNNIPNRISYLLDISGPSELVDTACSSSLVALNRARDAVRLGQCDGALVIGVNVILEPMTFAAFSETGLLSERNRCKSFGVDGVGYVRSEGVGAVVVKPYRKAVADGDCVQALVRGLAVNHGGRVQSLTAPNPRQQAAAIATALTEAGIEPSTVGFVEAHGTGTALGDSVEILGLKSGFRQARLAQSPEAGADLPVGATRLGSIKSNLGHLEAAAGMAGLIKVLLSLRHRLLPKSLHCEVENPMLDLAGSPFVINHDTVPWRRVRDAEGNVLPLRAGLSSFGFGGTNGHAVLEEAPARPASPESSGFYCIPVSGLDRVHLRETVQDLRDALGNPLSNVDPVNLADVALTLARGRTVWPERLCFVAATNEELVDRMTHWLTGEATKGVHESTTDLPKALRSVLKPAAIDALMRHYLESGDPDGLAAIWVSGIEVDLGLQPGLSTAHRIPLPGTRFRSTPCWPVPVKCKAQADPQPRRQDPEPKVVADAAPVTPVTPGIEDCRDFIRAAVATALGRAAQDIDTGEDLAAYGFDSILAVQLLEQIKAAYAVPIFIAELRNRRSVDDLVDYVTREIAVASDTGTPDGSIPTGQSVSDPVFLLSAPRSGSTLLRTMLMGHPSLYAPPELHLLGFETMGARGRALSGSGLGDGLVEALADLQGIDADEARRRVSEWETADLPVAEVYDLLTSLCAPRRLVDKSPSYGADANTLARGDRLFPGARYLHLVRRPEPMMTSFVANRFHKLIGAGDQDPWQVSDKVWSLSNQTIADFSASLPPEASLLVHYETLVSRPASVAKRIADWLGLGFDDAMLDPYGADRMTKGLAARSLSVGDPNFLDHDGIDTAQANEWLCEGGALSADLESPQIAQRFGYDTGRRIARIDTSRSADDWVLTVSFEVTGLDFPDAGALRTAVHHLVLAWPILGMRLDQPSGQLTSDETAGPIVRLTRSGTVDTDWIDQQLSEIGRIGKAAFAVDFSGPKTGATAVLTLLLNHHVCDGASALRVARDLVTLLAGEVPPPSDPETGYLAAGTRSSGETSLPDTPAGFRLKARRQKTLKALTEDRIDLTDRLPEPVAGLPNLADVMGAGLLVTLADLMDQDAATILLRFHGRSSGQSMAIGNFAIDLPIGLAVSGLDASGFAAERAAWSRALGMDRTAVSEQAATVSNVRLNFQDLASMNIGAARIELQDAFEPRGALLRTAKDVPLLDLILRRRGARLELIMRHESGAFQKTLLQRLIHSWLEQTSRLGQQQNRRTSGKKGKTRK